MKRLLLAFALVAVAGSPSTTFAQTSPPQGADVTSSEDQAARLLFSSAREAFQAGNFEIALDRFQQAYDLSHRPQLLYNIGTTLDRLRRDRDALAAFERFLAEAPDSPNRPEVESRVRVLRAAVEEEDRRAAEREQQLQEQRDALERAQRDAEARDAAAQAAAATPATRARGMSPVVFYSLAGGAGALLGVGIGMGVSTRSLNSDYEDAAAIAADPNVDPITAQSEYQRAIRLHDDAQSRQTLTNVFLFSAGALAIGAGVVAIFTDWSGGSDDSRGSVTPVFSASPGGAYVGFERRF